MHEGGVPVNDVIERERAGELDDEDFEDIEHELCSSSREASVGFDPVSGLEAFRASIRSSHWRVSHGHTR